MKIFDFQHMSAFISAMMRSLLSALVTGYRLFISPVLPPSCRFYPSCSEYAMQALEQHGPTKGALLTVRRVCRCHPWNPGGVDEVPSAPPKFFT